MARRKNVKRIDPRYFLHETVNRGEELEEFKGIPAHREKARALKGLSPDPQAQCKALKTKIDELQGNIWALEQHTPGDQALGYMYQELHQLKAKATKAGCPDIKKEMKYRDEDEEE